MSVLSKAKELNPQLITKSSIMLGLGETDEQIEQTLKGNLNINSVIYYYSMKL